MPKDFYTVMEIAKIGNTTKTTINNYLKFSGLEPDEIDNKKGTRLYSLEKVKALLNMITDGNNADELIQNDELSANFPQKLSENIPENHENNQYSQEIISYLKEQLRERDSKIKELEESLKEAEIKEKEAEANNKVQSNTIFYLEKELDLVQSLLEKSNRDIDEMLIRLDKALTITGQQQILTAAEKKEKIDTMPVDNTIVVEPNQAEPGEKKKGFFSRLFGK